MEFSPLFSMVLSVYIRDYYNEFKRYSRVSIACRIVGISDRDKRLAIMCVDKDPNFRAEGINFFELGPDETPEDKMPFLVGREDQVATNIRGMFENQGQRIVR